MARSVLLPLLLLLAAETATAALPASLAGNWYNPEQSGHGVNIEFVGNERAVVLWYVYDRAGVPMPLYVDGQISGNRIVGAAFAPRGMRFGTFDRRELSTQDWGQVEIEFQTCLTGKLRYTADSSEFGSGEIPIQRLAQPASPCLPIRALAGADLRNASQPAGFLGASDEQSQLWGRTPVAEEGNQVPYVHRLTKVMLAPPPSVTATGAVTSEARFLGNGFLCELAGRNDCRAAGEAAPRLDIPFVLNAAPRYARLSAVADVPDRVIAGLGSDIWGDPRLPRNSRFRIDTDDRAPYGRLLIEERRLCVFREDLGPTCAFEGTLEEITSGLFRFELKSTSQPAALPYYGLFKVDDSNFLDGVTALSMFGSDGTTGLALHARKL